MTNNANLKLTGNCHVTHNANLKLKHFSDKSAARVTDGYLIGFRVNELLMRKVFVNGLMINILINFHDDTRILYVNT